MTEKQLRITAEPKDPSRCLFTVEEPVYPDGAHYFGSAEDAQGSPLPEALFAIDDVSAVLIAGNQVTIWKSGVADWRPTAMAVGEAIRRLLGAGGPMLRDDLQATLPGEDSIRTRVERILADEVNPMVAQHGGVIDLLDVKGNSIYIKMGGGCQGCASASATLRQGVEQLIREKVPEVGEILDTTDHAAGRNPYFAQ